MLTYSRGQQSKWISIDVKSKQLTISFRLLANCFSFFCRDSGVFLFLMLLVDFNDPIKIWTGSRPPFKQYTWTLSQEKLFSQFSLLIWTSFIGQFNHLVEGEDVGGIVILVSWEHHFITWKSDAKSIKVLYLVGRPHIWVYKQHLIQNWARHQRRMAQRPPGLGSCSLSLPKKTDILKREKKLIEIWVGQIFWNNL